MSKAKEISALWSEIRPQIGKMINLCHQIESHAELHDNVTADAFQKGYDAACKDIDIKSKTNAAYRKGLDDAWECARKIVDCAIPYLVLENYLEIGECTADVIKHLPASKAIEVVRQYEQKKEEQITKGDVVRIKSAPEVEILVTHADGGHVSGIALTEFGDSCKIGDQFIDFPIHNVEKTGEHYEIAEALRKMKENSNGNL